MPESETRIDARLVAARYRVISELGRGGMGTVWLADDTLTGRRVAVKELRPQQGSSDDDRKAHLRRALQEARSAARISHPNAVVLYDVIPATTADDAIYLIMELVNGPTLSGLVARRGGSLPAAVVARFGLQLLDVLEAAHELGIVHRDIKPGNVLIARGDQAKLTDFGIAHVLGGTRLTRGGTAGTLAYMAPELFRGQPITAANDVWSLGVTLFYAADGRVPFERDNDAATMHAILAEDIPAPRCAPALARVLSGMLRRDPAERFTIAQARDGLRPVAAHEPGTSASSMPSAPSGWPTPAQWERHHVPPSRQAPATGTRAGTPAGVAQPADHTTKTPPPPPRAGRFSRRTVAIAAGAVVLAAAGIVAGLLATTSSPKSLSLRATTRNPGRGPVSDIAFSPDGATLAATDNAHAPSSSQNAVTMWRTADGRPISSFPYAGLGNSVAFSPDGATLAIAGDDLYLWNVASHANVAYLPGVSPQSVAFGRGADTLAVGGRWNTTSSEEVGLLNTSTRQWTATLPGLTRHSYVSAIAFSPNGATLAASDSANGVLYVWNAASRSLATAPVPLTASTGPLAFSPDSGTLAVSDGGLGGVRLWDVASQRWGASLTDPRSTGVRGLTFSPDGKTLAVADANGTADLWEVTSGKLILAQQVSPAGVDGIAFSPDGKTLGTGDGSGQIKLWAVSGR